MYKFPDDFDAALLHFLRLEMICFTANQINFHFSKNVSIDITGPFEYFKSAKIPEPTLIEIPAGNLCLLQLIEHKIVAASVEHESALYLEFDGKQILRLISDSHYESFTLNLNGRTIII